MLKSENGKFINNQHLKNMNTLQQSRQKVILVMVLFDDVLFLFKKIECFNVKNNFEMLLNVFQSPGHDNELLNIL